MPDHAGFAAAITIRERVLSEALLFAYSRPSFSRDLVIPVVGTGPAVLLQAFLSPPTVTCDATRDAIVVGVDLPGALTINEPTGVETHFVLAHVDIAVPPVFTLEKGQLTLSPAHEDVKVVVWSYTVVGGGAFKPATDAYLRSSVMAERLSETVQLALDADLLPGSLDEDISIRTADERLLDKSHGGVVEDPEALPLVRLDDGGN